MTPARAQVAIGAVAVVAGGLLAAVASPLKLEHGSWAAAYLVLIVGVAQYVMGRARAWYPPTVQPASWAWAHVAAWNLGSALVIGGTQVEQPVLVYAGSAMLFVGLGVALNAARPMARPVASGVPVPWLLWAYRFLLIALAVSICVGMLLSYQRHG